MLTALRNGAKKGFFKYILLGLLVLAGGGLVFTDVGGFFRGGVGNNLVAKGKNIEISTIQFDRTVRRILARQGMSPQEAYNLGMINQILNGEVQTQILTREAQDLGVAINDKVVMAHISKIAEPLAQNGVSKREALQQVLNSQGISEGEFIQAIRQEMGNTLFRSAIISEDVGISRAQAEDLYQYQNEIRDARGFVLSNKFAEIEQEASDENLQKYYEANKADFLISEKRNITVATLKKEMLQDKVEISDEELKAAYAENLETYKKPERRKLAQAIINRQTDADEVVKKLNKGSSLKKAVKTVTGNTKPFIGENDFEKGGLLEQVAEPVFEAKKDDIIGPIQTPLGWHVLVLKEILEPQTDSFETVKKQIKDEMLQDRLIEDLVETANILDDRLASGEPLEDVVADLGLTTEEFKNFNQAGLNKEGKDLFGEYQGDRAQILEAAFDFEQEESSPVMELADGRFITVRVDNVEEKSYTPFETVKEKLKLRWEAEQKRLANQQRAEDAMAAIQSGKTLDEVAKTYGAKIEKFDNLKRATTPKAPLTLPALRTLYDAKQGVPVKLDVNQAYVIAEVTDVDLPKLGDTSDKDIKAIIDQTKQVLPQEKISQYINNLSMKYDVQINERVLKQVYGSTDQN